MVTQLTDHYRKLLMKHGRCEESRLKINTIDPSDRATLLTYFMIIFILYVSVKEYYKRGQYQRENEECQEKLEELQKKLEDLQKEIGRRKEQFKFDWRKEEFQSVNVTLDEATAHPVLFVSENGRQVTWQERSEDLPSSKQRFDSLPCVLGQLKITLGRCFWEVEVGTAGSWDMGICRDNVTRNWKVTMSPQNGFWAIRLYEGEYWALTSPETQLTLRDHPHRVGIFLDFEAGDVSFYNMADGSHIFTFPQSTFYSALRPLFRLWSSDSGPLTIVQEKENTLTL
ncbi:butyrophilin subfamily 1 member A1-like isoform X2 [Nycticebus coucang]|uniref:butyrophilin subfamily 1 member A1-like isoform X2 n=1 Tax=Nycticebus coucang TaxID=9470 RepID=UPI00234CC329|nr:butyrophilin subfamily 1 member A1-like isoform X2 [Nycticebus coucang]